RRKFCGDDDEQVLKDGAPANLGAALALVLPPAPELCGRNEPGRAQTQPASCETAAGSTWLPSSRPRLRAPDSTCCWYLAQRPHSGDHATDLDGMASCSRRPRRWVAEVPQAVGSSP